MRPSISGVVCLGASAGGLHSLENLLRELRGDFPWPILISQHLQADHVSRMAEILSRATPLAVREAIDGEIPVGGTVYTSPSASELGVAADGRLTLRPPVAGRPQRIDHLFATASFASPGLIIACVLSGTGSDGAAGALVVKLNGGTVLAESEESAQYPAMPAAATKAGAVDATCSATAMGALLTELAMGALESSSVATENSVRLLAEDLRRATGTRFDQYRSATIRRRALKRKTLTGVATLDDYRALVARDATERDALVHSLLIPVTEFFRDVGVWDLLNERIIPALVARAEKGLPIRVWCAGCAGGEEAYSIAILIAENLADRSLVQILGTDLDAEAIQAAEEGYYESAHMRGVDAMRRDRFFQADGTGFQVSPQLRACVAFRHHDLTRDPAPGAEFDLIICRNVLIYFDDALQFEVVEKFRNALARDGTLLLGRSETIPKHHDAFVPIVRHLRIFRARGAGVHPGAQRPQQADSSSRILKSETEDDPPVLVEEPDTLVLTLSDAWVITTTNARARDIMGRDTTGENVLDVFPRWQGSPVHDALKSAMGTGRSLHLRGVPVEWGTLDLTLEPLHTPARTLLLIGHPTPRPGSRPHDPVQELEEDLAATNEELQSANEELAATNEELQSANEELASLNEEFQSTNENLASTNADLEATAAVARPEIEIMRAVMDSRPEPILTCDAAKRVLIYNRAAGKTFGLEPRAIGALIDAARLQLDPKMLDDWMRSADGPPRTHAAPDGKHNVRIERLNSTTGRAVGWMLSWLPR